MTESELLIEGARLLGDKKDAQKHLNAVAKETMEATGVDKAILKKLTDYAYHMGVGWVDGDPLAKSDEPVLNPDKISAAMKKLVEIVEAFRTAGLVDGLNQYINALNDRGISLSFRTDGEFKPLVDDVAPINDAIDNMKGFKKVIVDAADEMKGELAQEAEDANLCPKNKFTEIVGLYDKRENGKDISDQMQDKLLWTTLYETALNKVNDGSESSE